MLSSRSHRPILLASASSHHPSARADGHPVFHEVPPECCLAGPAEDISVGIDRWNDMSLGKIVVCMGFAQGVEGPKVELFSETAAGPLKARARDHALASRWRCARSDKEALVPMRGDALAPPGSAWQFWRQRKLPPAEVLESLRACESTQHQVFDFDPMTCPFVAARRQLQTLAANRERTEPAKQALRANFMRQLETPRLGAGDVLRDPLRGEALLTEAPCGKLDSAQRMRKPGRFEGSQRHHRKWHSSDVQGSITATQRVLEPMPALRTN